MVTQGLVQIQDVILTVESATKSWPTSRRADGEGGHENIATSGCPVVVDGLDAQADRAIVGRKFIDYGTSDVEKVVKRCDEVAKGVAAKLFLDEMRICIYRFDPIRLARFRNKTDTVSGILIVERELTHTCAH